MVRTSLVAMVKKRVNDYVVRKGVYHANHKERSNHFASRRRFKEKEEELRKPPKSYPKSSWKGAYDVMTVAYEQADIDNLKETLDSLDQINRQSSDDALFIYVSLLKKCAEQRKLEEGKKIHAHMVKNGHVTDRVVSHLVMQTYCAAGDWKMTYDVFNTILDKTPLSYSLMMTAYAQDGHYKEVLELYNGMTVPADAHIYATALYACACLKAFDEGVRIHRQINKDKNKEGSEMEVGLPLENAILNLYAKCGDIETSKEVFRSIQGRNATTWNVMISAYLDNGFTQEGLNVFKKMLREPMAMQPTSATFVATLDACASIKDLEEGRALHTSALEHRKGNDVKVMTAVLNMYAKCGRMEEARKTFDGMTKKDIVVWNTMVSGYAQNDEDKAAFQMYDMMLENSVQPDRFTYVTTLAAATSTGNVDQGRRIHRHMLDSGIPPDALLRNSLLYMYAKCGCVLEARQIFDRIQDRDVVAWTAMITAYTRSGHNKEALELYKQMDVEPNGATFVAVLEACDLEEGKVIDGQASKSVCKSEMRVQNAIMSMYARCGQVQYAKWEFDRLMTLRDTVSWNTMLSAYVGHGQSRRALELFPEMQLEGVQPDETTLSSVLEACSQSGLFKEARRHFICSEDDHGFSPELLEKGILEMLPQISEAEEKSRRNLKLHSINEIDEDASVQTSVACNSL